MDAPPGWKSDPLTKHFSVAQENVWATYVRKKQHHGQLEEIDGLFVSLIAGLESSPNSASLILEGMFLLRSHVAFRAGSMLTYSTQLPEAFPLFRATLEYALYAMHINTNPDAGETWIKRSDSKAARKAARDEFTHGRVKRSLIAKAPTLGANIEALYEQTIDFGGHPNDNAILGAMQTEVRNGKKIWKQEYFAGDGLSLEYGFKTAARVGVGSLSMFELIYGTRAKLLGLDLRLKALRGAL